MTSVGVWNPSHWPNLAQLQTHRGSALEPKCQGMEVTHLSCSLTQLPPKPPQGKSIACQPSPFLPSQPSFLWEAALPPFPRGGAGPEALAGRWNWECAQPGVEAAHGEGCAQGGPRDPLLSRPIPPSEDPSSHEWCRGGFRSLPSKHLN